MRLFLKSIRVLPAIAMRLGMPPFMPDITASCSLNKFMNIACGILFLPYSGLRAKERIQESRDTYPRHSLVGKLREREVPNTCSGLKALKKNSSRGACSHSTPLPTRPFINFPFIVFIVED